MIMILMYKLIFGKENGEKIHYCSIEKNQLQTV